MFQVQQNKRFITCFMMIAMMMITLGSSFTIVPNQIIIGRSTTISSQTSRLYDEPPRNIERGVSVDQDGKSNVWAIEPKVEIEQKSKDEQSTSTLFAIGGLTICGAIAAFILTNLPDPNQF